MTVHTDSGEMVRELMAIEACRRLTAEYSHGVDKRDRELFASIWAPGAEWESNPAAPYNSGIDAIMTAIDQVWAYVPETEHWHTNHVIDVDLDAGTATGMSDALSFAHWPDGRWTRTAITYRDTYACIDGSWLISKRLCQIHHSLDIPATSGAS